MGKLLRLIEGIWKAMVWVFVMLAKLDKANRRRP